MTGVSLRERLQHTPFVVPVIALLVLGLGLSLWLSTKAAQDSYKLGIERTQNQSLIDQRDALKRTYESGNSAPELSDKAARLGMIPADNPARMIVDDPRRPRVVGKPEPAFGRPMGSLNPDTAPDPADSVDPSQVDDSIGLGGRSGSAGSEADRTTTPPAHSVAIGCRSTDHTLAIRTLAIRPVADRPAGCESAAVRDESGAVRNECGSAGRTVDTDPGAECGAEPVSHRCPGPQRGLGLRRHLQPAGIKSGVTTLKR